MPTFFPSFPFRKQRLASCPARRSLHPWLEELESRFQPAVIAVSGGGNLIVIDSNLIPFRPAFVSPAEQPTGSGSSSSGSTPSSSVFSSSSPNSPGAASSPGASVPNFFFGFGVASSTGGIGTGETPGEALIPNYFFQFGSNSSTGVLFNAAANSISHSAPPPASTALPVPPTSNQNIAQQPPGLPLLAPLVYGDSEILDETEEGEPLPSPQEDEIPENPLSTTPPQGQEPSSLAPVEPPTGKDSVSLPAEDAFALPESPALPRVSQEPEAADQQARFWSSISSKPNSPLLETAGPSQEEPQVDLNNVLLGVALAIVPAWVPPSDNLWKENKESRAMQQNA